MNGRGESFGGVSLLEALTPNINLSFLLYKAYSVGLLASYISSNHLFDFYEERKEIFRSSIIIDDCLSNFCVYLNGALYLDGKALIPLLPLYVLATGFFLKEILNFNINFKVVFLTMIISILWIYLDENSLRLYFYFGIVFSF